MRFINDNLYPLFAGLLLVIASSCWFALPEPAQPKSMTLAAEPWRLPATAPRDTAKAIESITARKLWGEMAGNAANAAPPVPPWKVMGIARNGAERFILMAYEDKPVTLLRVGDALPDGMKIARIDDDRFLVITADKKKVVFGMYKDEPTK